MHSCLHPPSSAVVWHLCPLDQTSHTHSFWEWQSSVLLFPATEISSWFQSHDKFRLPYMVCDFVIYISYGCSSHMNDFHFTFSKIHRLNLALFIHGGGNRYECSATEWRGRRRWGRGEEQRLYHSSLMLRCLPDVRKYPAKRKIRRECWWILFYCCNSCVQFN